ncbi:MAG: DUF3455 domain-containing protein [Burkholderiales bacterium]
MQFLTRVGARGVQIYECRATGSNATPAWAFVAPEADLFDRDNRKVGTHGAGPFWQAHDGSRIVGQVAGRVDAPVAGAIDWLLLKTKNVGPEGRYSRVGTIQRINTVGGMAPSKGCAKATLGVTARIEYTADYNLYTAR